MKIWYMIVIEILLLTRDNLVCNTLDSQHIIAYSKNQELQCSKKRRMHKRNQEGDQGGPWGVLGPPRRSQICHQKVTEFDIRRSQILFNPFTPAGRNIYHLIFAPDLLMKSTFLRKHLVLFFGSTSVWFHWTISSSKSFVW